jgi:signal transduction histidine kinase
VRRIDVLITGVLLVLAAWLSVLNIGGDPEVRIDSESWWQLPVFLAAMLPVLWWRRAPLLAIGASTVVMAAHDVLFGHLVRCGAGLPLAFVFAFLVGLGCDRRKGLVAVALTIVLAGAVLIWDTAAGPEVLPVVAVILLVLWGIGQVARSRSALGEELRRRNAELAALRDRRAALEVADDRLRVSEQLETLLDARLGDLETAARSGQDDPREVLQTVEEDSRRTLAEMREIVGTLRGDGDDAVALAPVPSVAQLEALLERSGRGVLTVSGDPRELPASLELSAYRIVEHLADVLADDTAVTVHFRPDALEISIAGAYAKGADLRGALARARERARLHAGSVEAKVGRGHARVLARLPVG